MACAHSADGGFDVEFEDESVDIDGISCVICLSILREPVQAVPCGHRFCKNCISKVDERCFYLTCYFLSFFNFISYCLYKEKLRLMSANFQILFSNPIDPC